jgi:hypothetical protein
MPSRGVRVLLLASLALNLLVAGLVLGDALAGGGPGGPPRRVEMSLGPLARALDEDDRRAILEDLRGRPEFARRGPRGADLAPILAALRAEPFDPDRARAAFAEQARVVAAAQGAAQEALLARLAAMSPEARAAVADRLEGGFRHGP